MFAMEQRLEQLAAADSVVDPIDALQHLSDPQNAATNIFYNLELFEKLANPSVFALRDWSGFPRLASSAAEDNGTTASNALVTNVADDAAGDAENNTASNNNVDQPTDQEQWAGGQAHAASEPHSARREASTTQGNAPVTVPARRPSALEPLRRRSVDVLDALERVICDINGAAISQPRNSLIDPDFASPDLRNRLIRAALLPAAMMAPPDMPQEEEELQSAGARAGSEHNVEGGRVDGVEGSSRFEHTNEYARTAPLEHVTERQPVTVHVHNEVLPQPLPAIPPEAPLVSAYTGMETPAARLAALYAKLDTQFNALKTFSTVSLLPTQSSIAAHAPAGNAGSTVSVSTATPTPPTDVVITPVKAFRLATALVSMNEDNDLQPSTNTPDNKYNAQERAVLPSHAGTSNTRLVEGKGEELSDDISQQMQWSMIPPDPWATRPAPVSELNTLLGGYRVSREAMQGSISPLESRRVQSGLVTAQVTRQLTQGRT